MKKIIGTLVIALLSFTVSSAQIKFKNFEVEVSGFSGKLQNNSNSFHFNSDDDFFNVTIDYKIVDNLRVGIGTGYEYFTCPTIPDKTHRTCCPLFADVRYVYQVAPNTPVLHALSIVGVVDLGTLFVDEAGQYPKINHSFTVSPQLGVRIKIYKRLGINIRCRYQRIEKMNGNSLGVLFGISY